MLPDEFSSPDAFRTAFTDGLVPLIEEGGLGAYILALANAAMDKALYRTLHVPLYEGFERHRLGDERNQAAPDDRAVFEQLLEVGFASLQPVAMRSERPWELQFNQLRSFRPPRNSDAVIESLHKPFSPDGFHFNKPFLRPETFWAGELLGRGVDLLYNKFPFVEGHGLLVPEREQGLPQWLSGEIHAYVWRLCERLGESLPGVGFGYNAYGGFSSVNHLHLQMFVREAALPVELPLWRHNGGEQTYPSGCIRFQEEREAYAYIDSLHTGNTAYNLLYRPGALYVLPRRMQGSYQHAAWTGGFAWYEMCGGVVTFDAGLFDSLRGRDIEQEFAALRID